MKSILSVCYIQKGRKDRAFGNWFQTSKNRDSWAMLDGPRKQQILDIFRKLKTKTRTEVKGNPICTYKIRAIFWKSATTNSWDQALPCRCAFVSGTDSTLANAQEVHGQRTVFPTWQSLKPRRWYLENGRIWEVRRQGCTDTVSVSGTRGSCPLSPPMSLHPTFSLLPDI